MTTATAPTVMRAWIPAWRASEDDGMNGIDLVVGELFTRNPAELIHQEFEAAVAEKDQDRLADAGYALFRAGYHIGLAAPGMVAEMGQPGPEIGYETYLRELASRAGVAHVAGHVESDGLFHVDDDPDGAS